MKLLCRPCGSLATILRSEGSKTIVSLSHYVKTTDCKNLLGSATASVKNLPEKII